ncbi:MAG: hypothetical protein RL303_958 [Verrucomicrobiota bacterium]
MIVPVSMRRALPLGLCLYLAALAQAAEPAKDAPKPFFDPAAPAPTVDPTLPAPEPTPTLPDKKEKKKPEDAPRKKEKK